jgi:hypothetical protein
MKVCLIAPDPRAFVSGGNIYNRNLLRACARLFDIERMEPCEYFTRSRKKTIAVFDSIYLDEIAEQGHAIPPGSLLLIHYLPVFSEKKPSVQKLRTTENMLKRFDGWIVTGLYTQKWLKRHIRTRRSIVLIPPAIARVKKKEAPPPPPFRALIAANLIPVKGLIPLIRELEKQRPRNLQILLLGDPRLDPDYARKLQERVKTSAYLAKTITIGKPVGQAGLMRRLSQSHLLISASRFESFGMVIHESLFSGVPVWALPTGNIGQISHPLLHTFGSLSRLVASLKTIANKLPEPGIMATSEKRYGWKDAAKILKVFMQTIDRFES